MKKFPPAFASVVVLYREYEYGLLIIYVLRTYLLGFVKDRFDSENFGIPVLKKRRGYQALRLLHENKIYRKLKEMFFSGSYARLFISSQ